MVVFIKLVLIFFFGALLGWVTELFFRRIVHKKWINPGFLVGPWLPLYGLGLLGLYGMSSLDLSFITSVFWQKACLILLITVIMTLLEYFTGLIFIKGLKVKLWDYSDRKWNIQGIICPLFSLIWGLIGAAYNLLLHEYISTAVNFLSLHIEYSFFLGILGGFFIVDNVYSFRLVSKIRKWATENNVVVKYEHLKLSIKRNAEKLKQKSSFIYSFKSPGDIVFELNRYLVEKGKKFADEKFSKLNKQERLNENDKDRPEV